MDKQHLVLDHDECLELLASGFVGRLGVVVDGYPLIFPMQYAIDGGRVILRTNAGAKFNAAPLSRVSFEADSVDYEAGEGWSVIVQGVAEDISDAIDQLSEHARTLPLATWATGPKDRWLAIVPRVVTGRRIVTV